MKLISWNVNGINKRYETGELDEIFKLDPDIFCIQELHQKPENINKNLISINGYKNYFYPAESSKAIWGVATYTKYEPLSLKEGFGNNNKFDCEGRIQKFEFDEFELYNVYFPSGAKDERLPLKYEFYDYFTEYVKKSRKPQVICGDFNRMSTELDGWNPKNQRKNSGFLPDEEKWFKEFLEEGFIDSFRLFNQEGENYTWWWNSDLKKENKGIRFDYFLVHEQLKDNVAGASILSHFGTRDHAPITLELEF